MGLFIGITIILLWGTSLGLNFSYEVVWTHPMTYVRLLIQMHLFTGLFITAHDAMHGTVAPGRHKVNLWIGRLCTFLFIFNPYKRLLRKHHAHHRHVATDRDPDFHRGNERFLPWFLAFVREYITWPQIVLAAIAYNVMTIWVAETNAILYWVIPSVLSMLQLFYFGTFLPHRGTHAPDNHHHARSQPKNHLWAFLSCYFFGYHYTHHDQPGTPWWRLWRVV